MVCKFFFLSLSFLLAKEFLSLELRVKLTLCDMLEYGYVLVNVARHLCSVVLVLFFVLFFFSF